MTAAVESASMSRGQISRWMARRLFGLPASDWTGLVAVLVILIVLRGIVGVYWGQVLILFLINAIMVMSYRLITTMGGWSFAHVAFAAVGAYTMALLTTGELKLSFWSATVVGYLAAFALALVLAYPVLRTRQYNFFLATFAASAAIQQSLIQFSDITGGTNGIAFIPRPGPLLGFAFTSDGAFFALTLTATAIVTIALLWLDRSRTGDTIKAVTANEQLSESLGVHTWGYRTLAFVLGSSIAGIAGILLASFNGIVNPSDFGTPFMFKIVAAVIVGGTRTFSGPLLGLILLTALEELFRGAAEYIPLLWGLAVIFMLLFARGGLEGLLANLLEWLARLGGRPRHA